jgi:hypothetical protein
MTHVATAATMNHMNIKLKRRCGDPRIDAPPLTKGYTTCKMKKLLDLYLKVLLFYWT